MAVARALLLRTQGVRTSPGAAARKYCGLRQGAKRGLSQS